MFPSLRLLNRALAAWAGLLACAFFALVAHAQPRVSFTPEEDQIIREKWPQALEKPSGLRYVVLQEGTGPRPRPRQRCKALYEGMLLDGTMFDRNLDRDKPFVFVVGSRQVIAGWEEAFMDMRVGEKRVLIIPYALGYGLRGRPPDIPNRATLVFTVELLGVE
jgi:peptidylprolyl isomerase